MKINGVCVLVLALTLGQAGSGWAVSQSFPVNFTASYTSHNADTLVKVEGSELRVSVNAPNGEAVEDYLMDSTQGTIAKSSGVKVAQGQDGYSEAYNAVVSSLTSVRDGVAGSSDTSNVAALDSTLTYLQDFA